MLAAQLPRLAKLAIKRAEAGKPAALLKTVRGLIRELQEAREQQQKQSNRIIEEPGTQTLTGFERRLLENIRQMWTPTKKRQVSKKPLDTDPNPC
jgi:flagellin-specific chaperone FliS